MDELTLEETPTMGSPTSMDWLACLAANAAAPAIDHQPMLSALAILDGQLSLSGRDARRGPHRTEGGACLRAATYLKGNASSNFFCSARHFLSSKL
jgi:hypothetical protein